MDKLNEKIFVLVPCRAGSQRVKNKNTRPFAGSSLFEIKIRQLLNVPEVHQIIVSTDDSKVIDMAESFASPKIVIKKREPYYAGDCTTDELIEYFARTLDLDGHLLWTHVTSPFVAQKTYSRAIKAYFDNLGEFDSLMSTQCLSAFVWDEERKGVNYDFAKQGFWPRTQTINNLYAVDSGIFLIPFSLMKQTKNRVGAKPYYFTCNIIQGLDIDDEEGFKFTEILWKLLMKNK